MGQFDSGRHRRFECLAERVLPRPLFDWLRGLTAHAAYISAYLRQKLRDVGLALLTRLPKNLKGPASLGQVQQLKHRRIIVTRVGCPSTHTLSQTLYQPAISQS